MIFNILLHRRDHFTAMIPINEYDTFQGLIEQVGDDDELLSRLDDILDQIKKCKTDQ